MRKIKYWIILFLFINPILVQSVRSGTTKRKTTVSISGEKFLINGIPTFKGRKWHGYSLEGLLPNSRMVQAIFDDSNKNTSDMWQYPDTQIWDPERNTREFIQQMKSWRKKGLLGITVNLQGGNPRGYIPKQPWKNSAIDTDGNLIADYMNRLEKVLNKSDELGMVVILGIFYFGQDELLKDEVAVKSAVINTLKWLSDRGYTNVIIEINNECNINYDHGILKPNRVFELISLAKGFSNNGIRYLVSTSFSGGKIPATSVIKLSDYIILHGNGIQDPAKIVELTNNTRKAEGYTPKPIVFNEDDHFDFDKPINNFVAATSAYASWGYLDLRNKGEGFNEGYQSVPVDWAISSDRKKGFFDLVEKIFVKGKN